MPAGKAAPMTPRDGQAPKWTVGRGDFVAFRVDHGELKPTTSDSIKLGTILYCDGRSVGQMDTPELAAQVVAAMNAREAQRPDQVAHDVWCERVIKPCYCAARAHRGFVPTLACTVECSDSGLCDHQRKPAAVIDTAGTVAPDFRPCKCTDFCSSGLPCAVNTCPNHAYPVDTLRPSW